ncbi:MAG: ABC transporter permease [Chlorobiaceae bacterium]|nr:ABC transporter permease [Chlorobiaceae bacterium]
MNLSNLKTVLLGLVVPLLGIAGLETVCGLQLFPPQIVVPPHLVFATLIDLMHTGELQSNMWISMTRVFWGFTVGVSIGFILGVLMALSPRLERLLSPFLSGLNQVPLFGWIPLMILWFGIGEVFKVVFISLGAFFPMLVNTFEGINGVPKSYIEVARAFEFTSGKLLAKVLLPGAVPSIFTGIKLALGMSWMLVIGAELVAAGEGVGYMIVWGRQLFQMDLVFVGILVVGSIGYIMFLAVNTLERFLVRGYYRNGGK